MWPEPADLMAVESYGRVVAYEARRGDIRYRFEPQPDGSMLVLLSDGVLSVPVRRAQNQAELLEILDALGFTVTDLVEV